MSPAPAIMSRVSNVCKPTVQTMVFVGSLHPACGFRMVCLRVLYWIEPHANNRSLIFFSLRVLQLIFFQSWLYSGVETTMATFCKSCPSGCGPFRNKASIFATAEFTYASWSSTAQQSISYMSSIGFGTLGTAYVIFFYQLVSISSFILFPSCCIILFIFILINKFCNFLLFFFS